MFSELFSIDNLFKAWREFKSGKTGKEDVMYFEYHLENNIFSLYDDIVNSKYKHSKYKFFQVFDNKKRDIYKADVRDRVVHQILYKYLLSIYEPLFISDSYSSRKNKGHHKAVKTFQYFAKIAQFGNFKQIYVLKMDIRKYFDSVDHSILLRLLEERVLCPKTMNIIKEVINSFENKSVSGKGIPLGNVTSQVFANIYLHKMDIYIKNKLKCNLYIRYNDDLLVVVNSYQRLNGIKNEIIDYSLKNLKLNIPKEKTSIKKLRWGVDFLGYVILPKCVLLRGKTKYKIYSNVNKQNLNSYMGILNHCNSHFLKQKIVSKTLIGDDILDLG